MLHFGCLWESWIQLSATIYFNAFQWSARKQRSERRHWWEMVQDEGSRYNCIALIKKCRSLSLYSTRNPLTCVWIDSVFSQRATITIIIATPMTTNANPLKNVTSVIKKVYEWVTKTYHIMQAFFYRGKRKMQENHGDTSFYIWK